MTTQIVYDLGRVVTSCADHFFNLLTSTGMYGFYLSALLLVWIMKFWFAPVFGAFQADMGSDTVRKAKEINRKKGKFERNYRGKYSK